MRRKETVRTGDIKLRGGYSHKNNLDTIILVTAIGTINGTAIIKELRQKLEQGYIIGADIYPAQYIVNSRDVDEFFQFPPVGKDVDGYINFLRQFCVQHRVDGIYAVIDEEVLALAQHRDEFEKLGVTVCVPNLETVEICHNKARFCEWMKDNMPDYTIHTYQNVNEISKYPVFVKPIHGRASVGCRRVDTKIELEDLKLDWNEQIVQEYVAGELIAADVIANPKYDQFYVIQRKELLRNGNGCGTVVEIINDERISTICMQLAQKMGIVGVVNVEFFVNDKDIKIIEVNPRLPAGTAFTCMAGGNTVLNALKIARKEKCEYRPIDVDAIYARRYETYVMK